MNYLAYAWEFFAAVIIAESLAVGAMKTWPSDTWQYVILIIGGLAAGVKAVDARRRPQ